MKRAVLVLGTIVACVLAALPAAADRPLTEVQTLQQALGSPGNQQSVAVSTTTAQIGTGADALSPLVGGAMYEVGCTVTVHYRTGAGTQTAVTTDPYIPVGSIRTILFKNSENTIAFIADSGSGTCCIARKQ